MNRIVAFCFSLVFAGVLASGQELTKEAKIERILALADNNAILDLMKSSFTSAMPTGMTPEQRAKVQETQRRMLDSVKTLMVKIRPQLVKVYGETFSAEEIDSILAFYQSPAGHALLDKTPVIMSKTMALMMPEMQRLVKEITSQK
ncbi:MAG: DUF2059 domain-containing protein [Acidobacteriota bacterium]|nr:DUF2059 domain-containing protein [Acidobacteriota bacterium]